MLRSLILLVLLCTGMMAFAQKDSTTKSKGSINKAYLDSINPGKSRQQWLDANYKRVAALKKDSAAKLIRKNFLTISESSVEYMISQAARLQKADQQQQLILLKQILDQLRQQKQSLLNKIQAKTDQLAKETDPSKRKAIENEIVELKKKLLETEEAIRSKEEAVRQLEAGS